jgi:hypothetical protein
MSLNDNILAYWKFDTDSWTDSVGNGYDLIPSGSGVSVGTGIISGCAEFNGDGTNLQSSINPPSGLSEFSMSVWVKTTSGNFNTFSSDPDGTGIQIATNWYGYVSFCQINQNNIGGPTSGDGAWHFVVLTYNSTGSQTLYVDGSLASQNAAPSSYNISVPFNFNASGLQGSVDEAGFWARELSPSEVTELYNGGLGFTYPFSPPLYYNNAQNDGDWGNLLNWWLDSGFTTQATALPTSTNPVNLYNQVTQNTQGADQCFCSSANFWSANFGVGLTLQASGVVNMQGTSILAGTTTDGVSMHDSSQIAATSVVDGNVTMRDCSRAFGSILGNATIYYDNGNGQYPIGGTVGGSVTYLGWPAISPQWFNDQVTGGADDGDFSNKANWWTDNTFTARPVNAEGTQELPDASTDVFIADGVSIYANTGTANPTVNSVTANNSNIQNISLSATNGFLFSGNEGAQNATLYGSVTFQDTAYNNNSVIQGTVTYKSAASLQNSWNQNSLGNLNSGASVGSTGFVVNISGGGGGFISRLLNLPWFIKL